MNSSTESVCGGQLNKIDEKHRRPPPQMNEVERAEIISLIAVTIVGGMRRMAATINTENVLTSGRLEQERREGPESDPAPMRCASGVRSGGDSDGRRGLHAMS